MYKVQLLLNRSEREAVVYLAISSLVLSVCIFFIFGQVTNAFPGQASPAEWYSHFSRNIFLPQTEYPAESILLPLLAKILQANGSTRIYESLCSALTLGILPTVTLYALVVFHSARKALIFMLLFSITFKYLWAYVLGFPDPLTIIFLCLAGLARKPVVVASCVLLAGLSHFSATVLATLCLLGLWYATSAPTLPNRWKTIAYSLAALCISKLLLSLWYFSFGYKLNTRIDWVLDKDLLFFLANYKKEPFIFWTTPGVSFLMTFVFSGGYLIAVKKYLLAASLVFVLLVAYSALFFTIDGLRVFYIVTPAAYVDLPPYYSTTGIS